MALTHKSRLSTIFGLFVALCLLTGAAWPPAVGQAEARGGPGVDQPARDIEGQAPVDQIIVKYRTGALLRGSKAASGLDHMQALSAAAGQQMAYVRPMAGGAHVLRLPDKVPAAQARLIASRLAGLAEVEYAEPDYLLQPLLAPDDPEYGSQWHYFETYGINLPAAWDITTGDSDINIAILDTGITDHSDLAGRWVGGYDFISNPTIANDLTGRDADPHDPGDWTAADQCGPGSSGGNSSWHGTHVAGTIGAASDNAAGVAGINWVSMMVPVRVLGTCGGLTSDIAEGMRWAAGLAVSGAPANPHPAKVLNMSLGGPGACGSTFQNAVNAVTAAGAVVVVAAGNSNVNASGSSPGNCDGVITVAATDRDGGKASYSNFGTTVEISAPGGRTGTNAPDPAPGNGVLSTLNTGLTVPVTANYIYYQGTSMAAPHVAGVASLMFSVNAALTPGQVLSILQDSANDFPGGSTCTTALCGAGIVNAAAALVEAGNAPALDQHVYLPFVRRSPGGISGQVREAGAPVAGVSLLLRFFNGSAYSTAATTTTNADGSFRFEGLAGLGPGQSYYVRYPNAEANSARLAVWATADVTTYSAGSNLALPAFDIQDVALIAPGGIYVDLPRLFEWQARAGTPTDSYIFNLFDFATGSPSFETDPPLGYVNSYTLNSLPSGFSAGPVYSWSVTARSPDGGIGLSYWANSVAFNSSAALASAPGAEPRSSNAAALIAQREGGR